MKKRVIILIGVGILVLIGIIGTVREVFEGRNVGKNISTEDGEESLVQNGKNLDEEKMVIEDTSNVSQDSSNFSQNNSTAQKEKPFPVLQGFGVNIDLWNKQTNLAGDLIFTKKLLFDDGRVANEKVFLDFGSKDKYRMNDIGSIEYWFYVPLKTKVRAPVGGKIQVRFFNHTQDWGVNIMQDGSQFIVSFEHLVNLVVKDGQIVKVGDVLGDAAPRKTFNYEIAMVELAVWTGGPQIIKHCPFNFLDESLKSLYGGKLKKVASDWKEFIGKDVYQQEKWVAPGCLVESIVEK